MIINHIIQKSNVCKNHVFDDLRALHVENVQESLQVLAWRD